MVSIEENKTRLRLRLRLRPRPMPTKMVWCVGKICSTTPKLEGSLSPLYYKMVVDKCKDKI